MINIFSQENNSHIPLVLKIINSLPNDQIKDIYLRNYSSVEKFIRRQRFTKVTRKKNKVVKKVIEKINLFVINPFLSISEFSNYTKSGRKIRVEWRLKLRDIMSFIFHRLDYETLKSPLTTFRSIASALGYHEDTVGEFFHKMKMRGFVKIHKYKKPSNENPFASRSVIEILPKFFEVCGISRQDLNQMRSYFRKKSKKYEKTSKELYISDMLLKKTRILFNKKIKKSSDNSECHVTSFLNSDNKPSQKSSRPILDANQTKDMADLICAGKSKKEAYKLVTGLDYSPPSTN